MAGEGGSFEKDLRLIGRDEERKYRRNNQNLSLDVRGGRERQRWSKERVLPVGLILIRLHTQIF